MVVNTVSKAPGSAPTVKGTALRGYKNYLEKRLEPEVQARLLAALRPDVRALFAKDGLLVSSMYPIEQQHHFVEVFNRVMSPDAEKHFHEMGREVASTDLTGIYRAFVWAASVPQTLAILTKVWPSYFSTGEARWKAEGRHRGTIVITDRHHHPFHYPVVAGYIEIAIELAGGKGARVVHGPVTEYAVPYICTWAS
jgi:uncharacterized protein (TIGR02265 family)